MLPYPQADASRSRIDIRVVNFGAPLIPDLLGFLDRLAVSREKDMPKADNGRAGAFGSGGLDVRLQRLGWNGDASSACRHCGKNISTGSKRAGTQSDDQDHIDSKLGEI